MRQVTEILSREVLPIVQLLLAGLAGIGINGIGYLLKTKHFDAGLVFL